MIGVMLLGAKGSGMEGSRVGEQDFIGFRAKQVGAGIWIVCSMLQYSEELEEPDCFS